MWLLGDLVLLHPRYDGHRAVVAVARKLAVLLHHLWVTGEDYIPLRMGVGVAENPDIGEIVEEKVA